MEDKVVVEEWRREWKWGFRSWGVSRCTCKNFFYEGWVESVNPTPRPWIYAGVGRGFDNVPNVHKGSFSKSLSSLIFMSVSVCVDPAVTCL